MFVYHHHAISEDGGGILYMRFADLDLLGGVMRWGSGCSSNYRANELYLAS